MKPRNSRLYTALLSAMAALPIVAQAQPTTINPAIADLQTAELPRVTQVVDANVLSVVPRSHLALLDAMAPVGSVPDATPMHHMQLILKRSLLRQSALDGLIAAQHDPNSASFHQWVTPNEFGATFGVADADIAAATAWLVAQGFTVNGAYPNRMQIDFSGNAGLVKRALHTQENRYTLENTSHMANAGDISVPTALKGVIVGVAGLNDLRPHAQHVAPRLAEFNVATQKFRILDSVKPANPANPTNPMAKPQAIAVPGSRGLVPYDLAKMYGVDTLHAAGVTGRGITIALAEGGSMVPADWKNFVEQFNLGSYKGTFVQIQPKPNLIGTNCVNPDSFDPGEDDFETLLDAEWATAMAPGAHIEVASCAYGNDNVFGGAFTAATNLVNAEVARPNIISVSYGLGELFTDIVSKEAIDQMWEQADAEGISVFVASGDSGANPSFNGFVISDVGVDANSFGTSPNDTVVGGTDTADVLDHDTSKYFSKTLNSDYGSVLSYVPEIPWNESCGNPVAAKSEGFSSALAFCEEYLKFDPYGYYVTAEGGSGGPSSVDAKPAWQKLVWNAAKDQSRDLPDVSLFAGSFNGTTWVVVCTAAEPCTPGFTGPVEVTGGTSLASPMFAGIQALLDEGLRAPGRSEDQGNAAPTLYALAAQEYGGATGTPPSSLAACNADNGETGTSNCVFHNVTRGGISTQCVQQLPSVVTPDCYFYGNVGNLYKQFGPVQVGLMSLSTTQYSQQTSAYPSQPGWSFAAGLGSVNATNLLSAWKTFDDIH